MTVRPSPEVLFPVLQNNPDLREQGFSHSGPTVWLPLAASLTSQGYVPVQKTGLCLGPLLKEGGRRRKRKKEEERERKERGKKEERREKEGRR